MPLDLDKLKRYRDRQGIMRSDRRGRISAHEEFDKLWREGYMSRGQAYEWLAREFGKDVVHMKQMNEAECKRVVELVDDLLRGVHGLPARES